MSTGALADAVGQPRSSMAACMAHPLARGALKSRKREDGITMWSLGDGTPTPPPEDNTPDEPLHPVPKTPSKPSSPFDLRKPRTLAARDAARMRGDVPLDLGKPKPIPSRDGRHEAVRPITIDTTIKLRPEPAPPVLIQTKLQAKFGVYSDNTFCIQRGTDAIWLEPEEFQELAEFIARTTHNKIVAVE